MESSPVELKRKWYHFLNNAYIDTQKCHIHNGKLGFFFNDLFPNYFQIYTFCVHSTHPGMCCLTSIYGCDDQVFPYIWQYSVRYFQCTMHVICHDGVDLWVNMRLFYFLKNYSGTIYTYIMCTAAIRQCAVVVQIWEAHISKEVSLHLTKLLILNMWHFTNVTEATVHTYTLHLIQL